MTSERKAYVYLQLPGTLETVPAALLRVQTLPDGTPIGRFRYGNRYLARPEAVALDPFRLPLAKEVFEFTQLKGIPSAVRDAAPDAWGRRVIEHKLEQSPADLQDHAGLNPASARQPDRHSRAQRPSAHLAASLRASRMAHAFSGSR